MQRLLGCSLACWLLLGSANAMLQHRTAAHLLCQGPDAVMTGHACDALPAQSADIRLTRAPNSALIVMPDVALADNGVISGRLIWQQPEDAAIKEGALIEVTIIGSTRRQSTYDRFSETRLSEPGPML